LTSPPITDVQTVLVPPGGATVVELKFEVPGSYIMVDHALSRVDRGAAGIIVVTGAQNPDVFRGDVDAHNHMEH
ncbi:MAG: nitrite reductase, copper-containing, partial [Sphingopyxis sp.]|nr:nitrite reductase, copper-containing [Sphingopyxis sp.]